MMDKTNILEMCEDTNPNRVCFFMESWDDIVSWFLVDIDGKDYKTFPNINLNRINYCPTCGAYIREVKIEKI